jgi:hypothetical protein
MKKVMLEIEYLSNHIMNEYCYSKYNSNFPIWDHIDILEAFESKKFVKKMIICPNSVTFIQKPFDGYDNVYFIKTTDIKEGIFIHQNDYQKLLKELIIK